MEVNKNIWGGFIVSKNITSGFPVQYAFREKSSIPQLNGWNLYSVADDEEYVGNSENFTILGEPSMYDIAPYMLEIFDAPYGTDLCLLYTEDVHVGFYDLKADKETTINEILNLGELGFDWGNPESEATYGTTFKEHGSHHQIKDLMIKAKASKQQFGQWSDDQLAANFIAEIAQKRGTGIHDVSLPNDLPRRLFLATGIQERADMARVIVNPDGSVQTAYPFNSHHPH